MITNLTPGETVSVYARDEKLGLVGFVSGVMAGGEITVPLSPGVSLSGRAVSDEPLREWFKAEFRFLGFRHDVKVSDDGTFELPHLPPVRGKLELSSFGADDVWLEGTCEATPGEPVTIELSLDD